jgi:hypothetical protein
MWDLLSCLSTNFFFSQALYYTDSQDFFVLLLYHSPELATAISDFLESYWFSKVMSWFPTAAFDSFSDFMKSHLDELIKYSFLFLVFIWVYALIVGNARLQKFFSSLLPEGVRLQLYAFQWSRDTRIQFEGVIILVFLLIFYATMAINLFDDDQEEFIEFFEQFLLTGVVHSFMYYLFRVGVHFFTFLEASIAEGRTFVFIVAQFRRDLLNTFAFIMRLSTLMIRFLIYETNDDILDSYYIFLGDFDDDEYYNELLLSLLHTTTCFDSDNNDDRTLFLEDEVDLGLDLFSLYFIFLAKLGSLMFYVPEGIARTFLALYISYLIIFEVHTIDRSITETVYLTNKRCLR